jgi:hypothetical protein
MAGALTVEQGRQRFAEIIPIPLGTVRIVVHPFFISHNQDISYDKLAHAKRELQVRLLQSAPAQGIDEFTLVMPCLPVTEDGTIDKKILDVLKGFENEEQSAVPGVPTWQGLVHDLRRRSRPYASHVGLAWNIVNDYMDASDIEDKLNKRGFAITQDTNIVLSGEWQEVCVGMVAAQMLRLPQVRKVTIDKHASLTSEYYSPADKVSARNDAFYSTFSEAKRYQLFEDDRYIQIYRK